MSEAITGSFTDPSAAADAVYSLRKTGAEVHLTMPAPFPEMLTALGTPTSFVGVASFLGALTGLVSGYALCVYTSVAWPLVVGGKPIVSWAPFTVVAFEATVLFAGISTLAALLVLAAKGRAQVRPTPPGTINRIELVVSGLDLERAEQILRHYGADEVRHVQ